MRSRAEALRMVSKLREELAESFACSSNQCNLLGMRFWEPFVLRQTHIQCYIQLRRYMQILKSSLPPCKLHSRKKRQVCAVEYRTVLGQLLILVQDLVDLLLYIQEISDYLRSRVRIFGNGQSATNIQRHCSEILLPLHRKLLLPVPLVATWNQQLQEQFGTMSSTCFGGNCLLGALDLAVHEAIEEEMTGRKYLEGNVQIDACVLRKALPPYLKMNLNNRQTRRPIAQPFDNNFTNFESELKFNLYTAWDLLYGWIWLSVSNALINNQLTGNGDSEEPKEAASDYISLSPGGDQDICRLFAKWTNSDTGLLSYCLTREPGPTAADQATVLASQRELCAHIQETVLCLVQTKEKMSGTLNLIKFTSVEGYRHRYAEAMRAGTARLECQSLGPWPRSTSCCIRNKSGSTWGASAWSYGSTRKRSQISVFYGHSQPCFEDRPGDRSSDVSACPKLHSSVGETRSSSCFMNNACDWTSVNDRKRPRIPRRRFSWCTDRHGKIVDPARTYPHFSSRRESSTIMRYVRQRKHASHASSETSSVFTSLERFTSAPDLPKVVLFIPYSHPGDVNLRGSVKSKQNPEGPWRMLGTIPFKSHTNRVSPPAINSNTQASVKSARQSLRRPLSIPDFLDGDTQQPKEPLSNLTSSPCYRVLRRKCYGNRHEHRRSFCADSIDVLPDSDCFHYQGFDSKAEGYERASFKSDSSHLTPRLFPFKTRPTSVEEWPHKCSKAIHQLRESSTFVNEESNRKDEDREYTNLEVNVFKKKAQPRYYSSVCQAAGEKKDRREYTIPRVVEFNGGWDGSRFPREVVDSKREDCKHTSLTIKASRVNAPDSSHLSMELMGRESNAKGYSTDSFTRANHIRSNLFTYSDEVIANKPKEKNQVARPIAIVRSESLEYFRPIYELLDVESKEQSHPRPSSIKVSDPLSGSPRFASTHLDLINTRRKCKTFDLESTLDTGKHSSYHSHKGVNINGERFLSDRFVSTGVLNSTFSRPHFESRRPDDKRVKTHLTGLATQGTDDIASNPDRSVHELQDQKTGRYLQISDVSKDMSCTNSVREALAQLQCAYSPADTEKSFELFSGNRDGERQHISRPNDISDCVTPVMCHLASSPPCQIVDEQSRKCPADVDHQKVGSHISHPGKSSSEEVCDLQHHHARPILVDGRNSWYSSSQSVRVGPDDNSVELWRSDPGTTSDPVGDVCGLSKEGVNEKLPMVLNNSNVRLAGTNLYQFDEEVQDCASGEILCSQPHSGRILRTAPDSMSSNYEDPNCNLMQRESTENSGGEHRIFISDTSPIGQNSSRKSGTVQNYISSIFVGRAKNAPGYFQTTDESPDQITIKQPSADQCPERTWDADAHLVQGDSDVLKRQEEDYLCDTLTSGRVVSAGIGEQNERQPRPHPSPTESLFGSSVRTHMKSEVKKTFASSNKVSKTVRVAASNLNKAELGYKDTSPLQPCICFASELFTSTLYVAQENMCFELAEVCQPAVCSYVTQLEPITELDYSEYSAISFGRTPDAITDRKVYGNMSSANMTIAEVHEAEEYSGSETAATSTHSGSMAGSDEHSRSPDEQPRLVEESSLIAEFKRMEVTLTEIDQSLDWVEGQFVGLNVNDGELIDCSKIPSALAQIDQLLQYLTPLGDQIRGLDHTLQRLIDKRPASEQFEPQGVSRTKVKVAEDSKANVDNDRGEPNGGNDLVIRIRGYENRLQEIRHKRCGQLSKCQRMVSYLENCQNIQSALSNELGRIEDELTLVSEKLQELEEPFEVFVLSSSSEVEELIDKFGELDHQLCGHILQALNAAEFKVHQSKIKQSHTHLQCIKDEYAEIANAIKQKYGCLKRFSEYLDVLMKRCSDGFDSIQAIRSDFAVVQRELSNPNISRQSMEEAIRSLKIKLKSLDELEDQMRCIFRDLEVLIGTDQSNSVSDSLGVSSLHQNNGKMRQLLSSLQLAWLNLSTISLAETIDSLLEAALKYIQQTTKEELAYLEAQDTCPLLSSALIWDPDQLTREMGVVKAHMQSLQDCLLWISANIEPVISGKAGISALQGSPLDEWENMMFRLHAAHRRLEKLYVQLCGQLIPAAKNLRQRMNSALSYLEVLEKKAEELPLPSSYASVISSCGLNHQNSEVESTTGIPLSIVTALELAKAQRAQYKQLVDVVTEELTNLTDELREFAGTFSTPRSVLDKNLGTDLPIECVLDAAPTDCSKEVVATSLQNCSEFNWLEKRYTNLVNTLRGRIKELDAVIASLSKKSNIKIDDLETDGNIAMATHSSDFLGKIHPQTPDSGIRLECTPSSLTLSEQTKRLDVLADRIHARISISTGHLLDLYGLPAASTPHSDQLPVENSTLYEQIVQSINHLSNSISELDTISNLTVQSGTSPDQIPDFDAQQEVLSRVSELREAANVQLARLTREAEQISMEEQEIQATENNLDLLKAQYNQLLESIAKPSLSEYEGSCEKIFTTYSQRLKETLEEIKQLTDKACKLAQHVGTGLKDGPSQSKPPKSEKIAAEEKSIVTIGYAFPLVLAHRRNSVFNDTSALLDALHDTEQRLLSAYEIAERITPCVEHLLPWMEDVVHKLEVLDAKDGPNQESAISTLNKVAAIRMDLYARLEQLHSINTESYALCETIEAVRVGTNQADVLLPIEYDKAHSNSESMALRKNTVFEVIQSNVLTVNESYEALIRQATGIATGIRLHLLETGQLEEAVRECRTTILECTSNDVSSSSLTGSGSQDKGANGGEICAEVRLKQLEMKRMDLAGVHDILEQVQKAALNAELGSTNTAIATDLEELPALYDEVNEDIENEMMKCKIQLTLVEQINGVLTNHSIWLNRRAKELSELAKPAGVNIKSAQAEYEQFQKAHMRLEDEGRARFIKMIQLIVGPSRNVDTCDDAMWAIATSLGQNQTDRFLSDEADLVKPSGDQPNTNTSIYSSSPGLRRLVREQAKYKQLVASFHSAWQAHLSFVGEFDGTLNRVYLEIEEIQFYLSSLYRISKFVEPCTKQISGLKKEISRLNELGLVVIGLQDSAQHFRKLCSLVEFYHLTSTIQSMKKKFISLTRRASERLKILNQALQEDRAFAEAYQRLMEVLEKESDGQTSGESNTDDSAIQPDLVVSNSKPYCRTAEEYVSYHQVMRMGGKLRDRCTKVDPEREQLNNMLKKLRDLWIRCAQTRAARLIACEEGLINRGNQALALKKLSDWISQAEQNLPISSPGQNTSHTVGLASKLGSLPDVICESKRSGNNVATVLLKIAPESFQLTQKDCRSLVAVYGDDAFVRSVQEDHELLVDELRRREQIWGLKEKTLSVRTRLSDGLKFRLIRLHVACEIRSCALKNAIEVANQLGENAAHLFSWMVDTENQLRLLNQRIESSSQELSEMAESLESDKRNINAPLLPTNEIEQPTLFSSRPHEVRAQLTVLDEYEFIRCTQIQISQRNFQPYCKLVESLLQRQMRSKEFEFPGSDSSTKFASLPGECHARAAAEIQSGYRSALAHWYQIDQLLNTLRTRILRNEKQDAPSFVLEHLEEKLEEWTRNVKKHVEQDTQLTDQLIRAVSGQATLSTKRSCKSTLSQKSRSIETNNGYGSSKLLEILRDPSFGISIDDDVLTKWHERFHDRSKEADELHLKALDVRKEVIACVKCYREEFSLPDPLANDHLCESGSLTSPQLHSSDQSLSTSARLDGTEVEGSEWDVQTLSALSPVSIEMTSTHPSPEVQTPQSDVNCATYDLTQSTPHLLPLMQLRAQRCSQLEWTAAHIVAATQRRVDNLEQISKAIGEKRIKMDNFDFDGWRKRYLKWQSSRRFRLSDLFRVRTTVETPVSPHPALSARSLSALDLKEEEPALYPTEARSISLSRSSSFSNQPVRPTKSVVFGSHAPRFKTTSLEHLGTLNSPVADSETELTCSQFIQALLNAGIDSSLSELFNAFQHIDKKKKGKLTLQELQEALLPKRQKQPSSESELIAEIVKAETGQCTCKSKFLPHRLDDNKYTFGSSKRVCLVRFLNNAVLVRVGGGWMHLNEYLSTRDPCRVRCRAACHVSNASKPAVPDVSATRTKPSSSFLSQNTPTSGLGRLELTQKRTTLTSLDESRPTPRSQNGSKPPRLRTLENTLSSRMPKSSS
ncbi:unnamed protein product [Calicophoron daubneyi]|uniref:Dystonin n=1 Tax=Calicophoron daubneyi TaxID=300641 RepID=A0AAV2SZB9_CALDB